MAWRKGAGVGWDDGGLDECPSRYRYIGSFQVGERTGVAVAVAVAVGATVAGREEVSNCPAMAAATATNEHVICRRRQ